MTRTRTAPTAAHVAERDELRARISYHQIEMNAAITAALDDVHSTAARGYDGHMREITYLIKKLADLEATRTSWSA